LQPPLRVLKEELGLNVFCIDIINRWLYRHAWGDLMNTVTVYSNYQVFLPKEVRDRIDLKVGSTMEVFTYGNRIELVPIQPMKSLKGIFKGINTEIHRESDRI
jgi:AbrB family looped-hinge helix DNA binding protein